MGGQYFLGAEKFREDLYISELQDSKKTETFNCHLITMLYNMLNLCLMKAAGLTDRTGTRQTTVTENQEI